MEKLEKFKQKRIKPEEQETREKREVEDSPDIGPQSKVSLLDQHSELKKKAKGELVKELFVL